MFILRRIYTVLLDLVETLVIAGAIFVVIYAFLFRPYQVQGQSMYPNFQNHEYVLTNLIGLHFDQIRRGDVLVFHSPPNQERDYIKRVIGLPGDTIMIKDGYFFINGDIFDENLYLPEEVKTYQGSFLQESEPIQIPQENYFVVGDNRGFSSDSREWGLVPREKIIGKSFLVYWPPQNFRLIKNPFTNEL